MQPLRKETSYLLKRRIPTPDNWCPTAENGTVEASCMILSDGYFRVCFWGEDDLGYELNFREHTGELRESWIRWVSNLGIVTQRMLIELGFERA